MYIVLNVYCYFHLSYPCLFSSSLSYKELQRDEKSLCAEIQALQKRFESWQRQTPASANSLFLTKAPPAPILEESTHDLPPEVKDFEVSYIKW